jgi:hypothetical protein
MKFEWVKTHTRDDVEKTDEFTGDFMESLRMDTFIHGRSYIAGWWEHGGKYHCALRLPRCRLHLFHGDTPEQVKDECMKHALVFMTKARLS